MGGQQCRVGQDSMSECVARRATCSYLMVIGCFLAQVECHPYLVQNELIAHCQARGLEVTAYSPLGSSDRAWRDPGEPVLLEDPVVLALAEKHGRSPAQILLMQSLDIGGQGRFGG